IQAQDYGKALTEKDFTKGRIRKGTKGGINGCIHLKQVWGWDGKENCGRERTLIIRKAQGRLAAKYALSNFKETEKSPQKFAFMQSQRFWIEKAFETVRESWGWLIIR
ncbi:MAG: hypothetical protein AAGI25_16085, partial [Bacteroidota bacterium]